MARQITLDQREWIEIKNTAGDVTGGFFFNGFHKADPAVYIEVTQEGVVNIEGTVNISGDCTIGGISFLSHIHTGDSGGDTSPPK